MRRLIVLGAVAATFVLAPLAALAVPTKEHFRDVGTDVDTNFCGTGTTVVISFDVLVNVFFTSSAQEAFDKITQSGKVLFTNPANGRTDEVHFAGQTHNDIVEGDEAGVHTHVFTVKGLPEADPRKPRRGVDARRPASRRAGHLRRERRGDRLRGDVEGASSRSRATSRSSATP